MNLIEEVTEMKRLGLMFVIGFALLLAACGNMSQDAVVEKLMTNLDDASSYIAEGTMSLESDGQTYNYLIEVAFQRPGMYRVTMRNETTNNEQIILKNDEGVFVLTPSLNKKFKFQSDWPLSSSQIYLYESLLSDILNDETAVFTAGEESYVFETAANYHGNSDLVAQIVEFSRETLFPKSAAVKDSNGTIRMSMTFERFEFNAQMADGFFDSEATMEQTQNTMGAFPYDVYDLHRSELLPAYIPGDTNMTRSMIGDRVIMSFFGDEVFTIIQETASLNEDWVIDQATGDPVWVNGVIGSLHNNTLSWTRNGVDFFLVSETLDTEQMISVATSVTSGYIK